MKYPKVVVTIANWKGVEVLRDCLSSLQEQDYPNYKIIVVDDCSPDDSVNFIMEHFPQVTLIALKKNGGYCNTSNQGIKKAITEEGADYVLNINNDTKIVNKNFITELVKTAEKDKKIGIVGVKVIGKKERTFQTVYYGFKGYGEKDNGQYDFIKEVSAVAGVMMFMRRELIEKIGLFDKRFYLGCDDLDYGFRARKAGFKVIYNGNIKLLHYGAYSTSSSGGENNSKLYKSNLKGYLLFNFKHLNFFRKVGAILRVLAESIIKRTHGKKFFKRFSLRDKWWKKFYFASCAVIEVIGITIRGKLNEVEYLNWEK